MPEERAHDLPDTLAELAREADGGSGHPSDDQLLAYRDGGLEPAAEERVQDHLVGCRECADRYLDLDALCPDSEAVGGGAGGERGSRPADLAAEAMWRELTSRVAPGRATPGETASGEVARGPARGSGDTGRRHALRALAAGLALAVVGLGLWVGQLRRQVDRLTAPRVNPPVLYLDEPVRGTAAPVAELPAPGVDDAVLLIVTPPPADRGAGYEAVLARRGGEVWRGDGLRPTGEGTLRLRLPARWLRPGAYELRITAPGAGEPGGTVYRFEVLPEARGPT